MSREIELEINGSTYFVEREADCVYLLKVGARDPYMVSYSGSPRTALAGPVNAGLECDCPDFLRRHAGTGSHGCKHLRALAAAGILPDPPRPNPEHESESSWGEWFRENQARAESLGLH